MSPLTHLLGSWVIAVHTTKTPRDCRLVTLAGILPDLDGLGLIGDLCSRGFGLRPTQFYAHYHHYLLHGALGAALIAIALTLFAESRWRVLILAILVTHIHFLCDFLGSRGPSPEDLWPIFYLGPFDKDPMWIWKGQWRLDAWPLRVVTVALFCWSLQLAISRKFSVVGTFNARVDAVFISVLQKWREDILCSISRWGKLK